MRVFKRDKASAGKDAKPKKRKAQPLTPDQRRKVEEFRKRLTGSRQPMIPEDVEIRQ